MSTGRRGRTAELREWAAQIRELARVSTNGGHLEDALLLAIAEDLERRADLLGEETTQ